MAVSCAPGSGRPAPRRLRRLQALYARHAVSGGEVRRRVMSWMGHARQADTVRLRERLLCEHPFRRAAAR